jgi:N6-L-threonylcarbamoyladenine synthase
MGALLVGASFARSLAFGLEIPLIDVNHMQAHVLAHFARLPGEDDMKVPEFPFICLTVSGGHTQLILAKDHYRMELLGQTLDDAAGEAFDKIAKLLGLPYPGGPYIDKLASEGNPDAFRFPKPNIKDYDFSFSGFKTAVLYFLQKNTSTDPSFVDKRLADICASVQKSIVGILVSKLESAADKLGVSQVAIAGGVAANSGLRKELQVKASLKGWKLFIPPLQFCTDNAAMIAITGYFKFLKKDFSGNESAPFARFEGL